ncbi:hypothetical protein MRX96_009126 [Rhipicephalus microplus]
MARHRTPREQHAEADYAERAACISTDANVGVSTESRFPGTTRNRTDGVRTLVTSAGAAERGNVGTTPADAVIDYTEGKKQKEIGWAYKRERELTLSTSSRTNVYGEKYP